MIQETFVTHKINLDSKPAYFILILPKYDFNSKLFISFEWEVVFFSNFAPPGTRAADVQYNSTGVRAPVYDRTKEQAHVDLVRVGQLHREPVTDKYASVQFCLKNLVFVLHIHVIMHVYNIIVEWNIGNIYLIQDVLITFKSSYNGTKMNYLWIKIFWGDNFQNRS